MKFTPITCIEASFDNEEVETITAVQRLITTITEEMRKTSLYIAECQDYDDVYNIDFDELTALNFTLERLKYLNNIC